MKIAVFGLGYVGITAVACLAREGHEIVGVDVSDEKVNAVSAGQSPIVEPGVGELMATAVSQGRIIATKDAGPHINSCDIAIVCVGTPSAPDGAHNMSYIAEVTRQIAAMTSPDRAKPLTVVYRSTMRPGTTEELIHPIFEQTLRDGINAVELVYNPEFLREGMAVNDFFNPPKIVVGTRDALRCASVDAMNANIKAPVFYTKYREAELTKFVDNTFHAVKIAFANEIGRVCTQLGISAQTVYKIFVSDTKLNISPYYFRPGGAFGGSCLPKDVRALQRIAADIGAHTHLMDCLLHTNDAHKHFLFEHCTRGVAPGSRVLLLGVAFKSDSDDLRESPNVDLARRLLQSGYELSIYDPYVQPEKLFGQNLGYAFTNLPKLRQMLLSREEAESGQFDLVVDTRGWSKQLSLRCGNVIDINSIG